MVVFTLEKPFAEGETTNVLVELEMWDDQQSQHKIRTTLNGVRATYNGPLPKDTTVFLLVNATVASVEPLQLNATKATRAFPRPTMTTAGLTQVVEACSGIGCLGRGLQHAGFTLQFRIDWSQPLLDLANNIDKVPSFCGDVGTPETLIQICEKAPEAGILAAGYSCQPFSKLGDRRAQLDPRSKTLTDVLTVGYLGRFAVLILECVPEVLKCEWVQQVLKDFTVMTGYVLHQDILHLHKFWVAKRSRWWAVLSHPSIGKIEWEPAPEAQPAPLIAHLLPEFLQCEGDELEQLKLDLYELSRFAAAGFDKNEVPLRGQMNTSLHSCGNQLKSCPCQCRQFALSDERLAKGGLHGLLVRLTTEVHHCNEVWKERRHVHPAELAILNGEFADHPWGPNLRTALCGLGQMASPLQSNWIGSHVFQTLAVKFQWDVPIPKPPKVLSMLMKQLLNSRDRVFGEYQPPCMQFFQAMVDQQVFVQPSPFEFQASDPAKPGLVPRPSEDEATGSTTNETASEDMVSTASMQPDVEASSSHRQVPPQVTPVLSIPQHIHFPNTGGIPGFEANRKRPAEYGESQTKRARIADLPSLNKQDVRECGPLPIMPEMFKPPANQGVSTSATQASPLMMPRDVPAKPMPEAPSAIRQHEWECGPLPIMPGLHLPPANQGVPSIPTQDPYALPSDDQPNSPRSPTTHMTKVPGVSSVNKPAQDTDLEHTRNTKDSAHPVMSHFTTEVPAGNSTSVTAGDFEPKAEANAVLDELSGTPCADLAATLADDETLTPTEVQSPTANHRDPQLFLREKPLSEVWSSRSKSREPTTPASMSDMADDHASGTPMHMPPPPEGVPTVGLRELGPLPRMPGIFMPPHPEGVHVQTAAPNLDARDAQAIESLEQHEDNLVPQTSAALTEATAARHAMMSSQEPKFSLRVLTPDNVRPTEVLVSATATAGELIVAEHNIGTLFHPIAPRTWVHTHMPLSHPIKDQPLVVLHQYPPADSKCPKHCSPSAKPELPVPCTRLEALWHQQAWVAPDEMNFYLSSSTIDEMALPFDTQVFADEAEAKLQAWTWLELPALNVANSKPWVSAAIIGHHWVPVVLTGSEQVVTLHTTEDGKCFFDVLREQLPSNVTTEIKVQFMPSAFHADCGFQTFAWILGYVLNPDNFIPEPITDVKACKWRDLFATNLWLNSKHLDTVYHLPLGGTKTDAATIHAQLSELLAQHGVWPERLHDRTSQLMAKLPMSTAKNIIHSPKAWSDLKAAANQMQPAFKLVMADELNTQIAKRASQKKYFGKAGKKDKPHKQSSLDQPTVRACDLQIPPGVFKQEDGHSLQTIRASDIGPNAQGILLVDQDESIDTLKLPTPLTPHGLAIIVLAGPHNTAAHTIEPTRFPALCTLTNEPLIVAGYMYQKGKQAVDRAKPAQVLAIEEEPTQAVRCLVYKDQAEALWEDMNGHPVKAIFDSEPILTPDGKKPAPVIYVWSREWVTKKFERVKRPQAEMFIFSFRVLTKHLDALLAKGGENGVYYEPRSDCGRFPSDSYHVTWLHNMNYREAKYAQQTAPHAASLVRHADRYGLRSDPMNATAIHTKHRPDTPLLLGNTKALYSIGPLPYSTTKEAVAKLLKAWNWEARPLHPKGRSQDGSGINWTIQATEDPQFWIYALAHGDVLITAIKDTKPVTGHQPFSIVASKKTMDQLQQQGQDPWDQHDPWKNYNEPTKRPVASTVTTMGATPAQLAAMEHSLEQKLLAAIHTKSDGDVAMDSTGMESRMTAVEQQIQHLQAGQNGLEVKLNQVQHQVEHQAQRFESSLDSKLQDQMDKIEHLLRKRAHHE